MDRRLARLIFGGTLALMSLIWYCAGGAKESAAEKAAQDRLVKQAKSVAADQAEAVRQFNTGQDL